MSLDIGSLDQMLKSFRSKCMWIFKPKEKCYLIKCGFIALVVRFFFKPENQLLYGARTIKPITALIDTAVL
jgi:hypothetical protein